MTRIIAGIAGGRRLSSPPGDRTRPTSDRVREALFSALESQRGTWSGLHVLDLYAGSGAVGLEAISRGAASALLVEHDRRAAAVVRANITALGLRSVALSTSRVEKLVGGDPPQGRRFDLVFADPPYPLDNADVVEVLLALRDNGWLAPGAVVAVERSSRGPGLEWPEGFDALRSRRYGETSVWYGRATQRLAGADRQP